MDDREEQEKINDHLARLRVLDGECLLLLPEAFYDAVADHWFHVVAPDKTEEYGVTAWQRLGARGIAAQLSGCYYRWERMFIRGLTISNPPMYNAVLDAFGYAILLHCVFDMNNVALDLSPVLPRVDHELLLDQLWWANHHKHRGMPMVALRMAHNMWGAINDA